MTRRPQMTPAQQHAQDASVNNLWRFLLEAEANLQARVDAAETRWRLCQCGIALAACRCPLRRDAGVRISYAKA